MRMRNTTGTNILRIVHGTRLLLLLLFQQFLLLLLVGQLEEYVDELLQTVNRAGAFVRCHADEIVQAVAIRCVRVVSGMGDL